ncbi:MAG: hypothetical protein KBE10_06005, partial [Trichococcus sp.]|nr:hypothetical protein [Trichococcus sp.]MBP9977191.1 hypothetical protein [Trichococcus sp.]
MGFQTIERFRICRQNDYQKSQKTRLIRPIRSWMSLSPKQLLFSQFHKHRIGLDFFRNRQAQFVDFSLVD